MAMTTSEFETLADAALEQLAKALEASEADCDCEPKGTGVLELEFADGSRIAADVVVSNADPKRTFLRLVPPDALAAEFREQIAALSTRAAYFKFHAALRELPDFSAYLGPGFDPRYLAQVKICPSAEAFVAAWQDAQAGRLPRAPLMEVQIPSVYDDSMAPPGHHVVSIWALWAPVKPAEGTWETRRQEMGERMIDLLTTYAPNFREGFAWMARSPVVVLGSWIVITVVLALVFTIKGRYAGGHES